ncbi:hypothetical protein ACR2RM_06830 [Pseudomonas aeruginosa]|uniref:hypothetical protein n=1 Tax=Pseudomonas aeruginosa TaxID=287 RepID=UPI003F317C9F
MDVDRELQKRLLQALAGCYPSSNFTNKLSELLGFDHHQLCCNASYLIEHGLLDGEIRMTHDGRNSMMPGRLKITAAGLDFIEEDGGLTAILGTVTVRLHADSIRELIALQVENSKLSEPEKTGLLKGVKSLTKAGLEEAVKYLVQQGLARSPDAIPYLQTLFQSVVK